MKNQKDTEQLQQTVKFHETLLRVSNHGILIIDTSRNIIEVNDAFCSFIGQNRKDVIESNLFEWLDTFSEDDIENWIKLEKAVHLKQIVSNYEFQLSLNNEIRYFDVNASLLGKIENEMQGHIISYWHDITERKKAEDTLKKSEKNYRDIFNNATDAIYIQDRGGRFLDVNQGAVDMYGYPKEFFLGKIPEFLSAPGKNDMKKIIGFVEDAFKGKSRQYDFWGIRKNGEVFPKIVRSQKGVYMGKEVIITFAIDITERKKMEEELIRLSNAFRMSIDSVVISDLEGKITDVNEATLKMYGTDDKANLIGKNSFDIFAPEDKVKAVAGMRELMGKGYSKDKKYNVILKDGSKIFVEMSISIMKGMKGEPIGFVGITRDIANRTQAENLLVQSEKKYRDLFEKSEDAILIIHNGKFVDCNQATVNMLRYNNKEEFLNTHPSELSPEKQPDGKMSFTRVNEILKIALKNGSHRFEWNHKKSDGEIFPVEVLLTAIFTDEKKQILYTVWRDITQRKQAEEELNKYREHLEELVKERTAELEEKNAKLEYFNKLFVGREFRIKELRDKVKELEEKISDI